MNSERKITEAYHYLKKQADKPKINEHLI